MTTHPLPLTIEEITPDWLTAALSQRHPRTVVDAVEVSSVIWGTAMKAFLHVTFSASASHTPPERLCIKGGFRPELREVMAVGHRELPST